MVANPPEYQRITWLFGTDKLLSDVFCELWVDSLTSHSAIKKRKLCVECGGRRSLLAVKVSHDLSPGVGATKF